MKNVLFIGLVMLLLASCSADSPSNDANSFSTEFVPIATVEMPEEFELGQSYNIAYTYYKPTTCHLFNDLYNVVNQNQRTIAVINTVLSGNSTSCEVLNNELVTRSFDFVVSNSDTHYFRFWQGTDDNSQDIYLEFEVPVN